jgi:hypothetical protein
MVQRPDRRVSGRRKTRGGSGHRFFRVLPCGWGLFAFGTEDEAAAAVETINGDYSQHCRTAREIAVEHFEATKLIREILSVAGLMVE